MKKVWEKYYDWVLFITGLFLTLILGWLIITSVMIISFSIEKAFRTPDSSVTKVEFDFKGLESLGLTPNNSLPEESVTESGELGEVE